MKYSHIYKTDCYSIALCRAENALTAFYDERLKEAGITVKQFCLLKNLKGLQEANTGELAERVNLERSTLTRNIQILIARGWIYDRAEAGRRAHQYALTEEGMQILEKASKIWDEVQKEVEDIIGKDKVNEFMETLYKLQNLNRK